MGVAQLAYEPQLQTITGLPARQEHGNLLKHVEHSEDAIHIFTGKHIYTHAMGCVFLLRFPFSSFLLLQVVFVVVVTLNSS
jgi:hypothetical protein